jgi:hypothetical protein
MSEISLFEEKQVRRAWNAEQEKWLFAIVDVIAILTNSSNPQTYWRVMKKRLMDEGNETVTNCNGLKMTAADGKRRKIKAADTEECLSPSTSVFFICVHSRSSVVEYFFSPILRQLLRARLDLEKQSGKRISTRENFKARPEATKRIARKKSSATFT